jgi:hypothetical protein
VSNISYENFFPYVQPMVPSCADPSMVIAIRSACIEFCEQTNYLTDEVEETLLADEPTYEISVPTHNSLNQIIELYANGLKILPKSPLELEKLFNGMYWRDMPGPPRYYTMLNNSEITVCPYPDVNGTLTGRFSYAPTRSSTVVDERVFDDYAEVIAQGALARLFSQPDQPYSNPQNQIIAERKFMSGIADAKARVKGGMSAATPMRVGFRRHW